jgi:hypothetical protein
MTDGRCIYRQFWDISRKGDSIVNLHSVCYNGKQRKGLVIVPLSQMNDTDLRARSYFMSKLLRLWQKGVRILVHRLRVQGVRTTLLWLYARGLPVVTGIPILKYSRITPRIYVGPQYRRAGKRKLSQIGVNSGVNMRLEFDDAAHGLALEHYCHLPTADDDAPTLDDLHRGVAFIHRVITGGGKVYIHCGGGVGRAPTMAAAYFISQGLELDEAIGLIKRSRPFINIVPAQMEQLERFIATRSEGIGNPCEG